MHVAACLVGKARPSVKPTSIIERSFESVKTRYDALGASDAIAKGTQLLADINSDLACRFPEATTSLSA
jgi:hypothetical protein